MITTSAYADRIDDNARQEVSIPEVSHLLKYKDTTCYFGGTIDGKKSKNDYCSEHIVALMKNGIVFLQIYPNDSNGVLGLALAPQDLTNSQFHFKIATVMINQTPINDVNGTCTSNPNIGSFSCKWNMTGNKGNHYTGVVETSGGPKIVLK